MLVIAGKVRAGVILSRLISHIAERIKSVVSMTTIKLVASEKAEALVT